MMKDTSIIYKNDMKKTLKVGEIFPTSNVIYICNWLLLSLKIKDSLQYLTIWMKFSNITLRGISRLLKGRYCMISFIYGNQNRQNHKSEDCSGHYWVWEGGNMRSFFARRETFGYWTGVHSVESVCLACAKFWIQSSAL